MNATATVLKAWAPTPTTRAIRVERPAGLKFRAGQHVVLGLDTASGRDDRSLSIASGPARPHLDLAVRTSESDFKRAFARLAPGDEVELEGPIGRFSLDDATAALMLCGGIGITPLKGMIEHVAHEGIASPVRLVYANRSPDEIAFREELDALAGQAKDLRITYTVDTVPAHIAWTGRVGRIDLPLIAAELRSLPDAICYTCGPPGMVSAMTQALAQVGVSPERVRTERFTGY